MLYYVAGLDGGGTKTAVTVADESGNVIRTFTSGAINYNGQDEASVRRSLHEIVDKISRICGGLEHCVQMCIGAAGVSNPAVISRMTTHVRECGYEGGLIITGDHEAALYGAHNKEYGMILIAGTGSICLGKSESGHSHRTGGFGHLIDDEGSGYSIGRDLISAVVQAFDGRIPDTVITDMVYQQLGIGSIQEIVGFVYDKQRHKKDIAALAPILSEACSRGDMAALRIARKSASSLVDLVVPVAEKLSMQGGSLAVAGSVLLKNSFVRSSFEEMLHGKFPGMQCINPKKDAAAGAVIMALKGLREID